MHSYLDMRIVICDIVKTMIIDPNIIRLIVIIGIVALLFLAFTYLVEFLRPIIIAVILIVIAYFLYRFFITGTLSI